MLIIYGSLYPWQFAPKHVPGNAFEILLHSWPPAFSRFVLRDTAVNVALYMPLGFAAYFVLRESRLPLLALHGPVLFGFLLSTTVEVTQLYTPHRDTSALDVAANTIGSALGIAAALLFERMAGPLPRAWPRRSVDRSALMLIFCWIAWAFFPLFPVLGSFLLIRKASMFGALPRFEPMPFLSAAALWYALGLLLRAAGVKRPLKWVGISILAVPAQFFVSGRQPTPSDLLGAIAAWVLFALRSSTKPVMKTEAWAFLGVVVLRGFSPFHFVPAASTFTWVPFGGLLNSEWQGGIQVLLEKVFYYASAIWLLRAAGIALWRAAAIVAVLLAVIEAAQTHLPGRTAEIMDPMLALLMGFILFILSRETGRQFQSAE